MARPKPRPKPRLAPLQIATVATNGPSRRITIDGVDEQHLTTDPDARYLLVRIDDLTCDHGDDDALAGAAPWPIFVTGHVVCPACLRDRMAGYTARVVAPWGSVEVAPDGDAELPATATVLPDDALPEDATPGGRPHPISRSPERVRDLLCRVDALAGSDPHSPWHGAALALRSRAVAGPLGAVGLVVEALEALVAHAEYRRAYGGAR